MAEVPLPFAARAQCTYLGWPMDMAAPLVDWTRRNHEATLAGDRKALQAGDRLTINWIAANRDPEVFGHAEAFRLHRDPADNLRYGAGIQVCPGSRLARLDLRVVIEALLAATRLIEPLGEDRRRWPRRRRAATPPCRLT